MRPTLLLLLLLFPAPRPPARLEPGPGSAAARAGNGLEKALAVATQALQAGDLDTARAQIDRALERDPNSLAAWSLEERWAEKKDARDERVYALHRQAALLRAQKRPRAEQEALRARLAPLDPVMEQTLTLQVNFVDKLVKLAEGYEKAKRPHSAIRAYKEALALDPERGDLRAEIERLAATPDPSLAEDARPRDLLEGVSEEWIAEHDAEHATWKERARLEKPNYVTHTDAGYEVLVRAAEAMEQMNAFYRVFFRYGAEGDKRSVPRIDLHIFKDRDEYLEDGQGPPVEWSGGQFTGGAVETYIGPGGFEEATGTLFHEAAHQFVSLATNAAGWLNEGMASFFEGSRILANGTVIMNLPANHRLFPLVERMERGWMSSAEDGIDPEDPSQEPRTAPTFRIVLENEYEWGPPWYAPTWGVVYFLYNFQDPADGRFVYRQAFGDYVDASGGKVGKSAIKTFEEVVLANPERVTDGEVTALRLPRTVDELNEVWKTWLVGLRDRQTGRDKNPPPYREWARLARKRKALDDAAEFYEKALLTSPQDVDLLLDFSEFLSELKNDDRAVRLLRQAAAELERASGPGGEPDAERLAHVERRLRKIDPHYQRLEDVRALLVKQALALVDRYRTEGLDLMAMDVAFRLGSELGDPELLSAYEAALQRRGHSPARWRLAYDEESLRGWNSAGLEQVFRPDGERLLGRFGEYAGSATDYSFLTLDEVTSGDFSMEAEVQAAYGQVAFAGLVFGRKSANDFHALVLFPPPPGRNGFVNLVTFYGSGSSDTWRRSPVKDKNASSLTEATGRTRATENAGASYKLRVDVTGRLVDVWVDDAYVATQEFPSLDVLRGSFGLLQGRGAASFRNVRYLARHARDPSALIERRLRLQSTRGESESINGSWVGLVPPFPSVKEWLQEPRQSWEECLGRPQLLVLWSCEQNEQVRIDEWLRRLAQDQAAIGLEVVGVLACWNEGRAEDYLKEKPFPGALALDLAKPEISIGTTFERYDIERFHLPRLLLLDVDGRVAWEGDPGFSKGEDWRGEESLLDVPLRELTAKRKLRELAQWKAGWPAARAALARGDLASAWPALESAGEFDPVISPEVAEAQSAHGALEQALSEADALGEQLAAQGREPALEALLDWGNAAGKPIKKSKALATLLKSENLSAWKRSQAALRPSLTRLAAGKEAPGLPEALGKLESLPGAFPRELLERLRAAGEDRELLLRVLESAEQMPVRWLASEQFGW